MGCRDALIQLPQSIGADAIAPRKRDGIDFITVDDTIAADIGGEGGRQGWRGSFRLVAATLAR